MSTHHDYSEIQRTLAASHALADPAEAHGTLAGALCALVPYRLEDWLAEILPDGSTGAGDADPVLQTLYEGTVAALAGHGMDFDLELFYVSAMLHDVRLTRPFDAHQMPFEEAGGQVAWVFGAAAGWTDDRRTRVAKVIEKHMWPSVDPLEDVEGHLLEVATGIDISDEGSTSSPSGSRRRSSRSGRAWTWQPSSPSASGSRVNGNRPAVPPTSPEAASPKR